MSKKDDERKVEPITLKTSLAKKAVELAIAADRPIFIWGSPGIGKSAIVKEIADSEKAKLYDVRALLLESIDLRGLPTIKDGCTQWTRPAFLPPTDSIEKNILFLDELNAAEPAVQAACYQLILDRRVGEYRLPKNCAIVCAGNLSSDRAHTNRMPSALANRLVHIQMEPNLNDWLEWALCHNVRAEVLAYIMFRPDKLFDFNPKADERGFATPRSWETVSRLLDATGCFKDKDDSVKITEWALIKGTIGDGVGTEFISYMETYQDLPNPQAVLMNPDSEKIPETPAGMYAICSALAQFVNKTNVDNYFKYIERLEDEFKTLAVKLAVWKNKWLTSERGYCAFCVKHANTFI